METYHMIMPIENMSTFSLKLPFVLSSSGAMYLAFGG